MPNKKSFCAQKILLIFALGVALMSPLEQSAFASTAMAAQQTTQPGQPLSATNGHAAREDVLIGLHYGETSLHEGRDPKDYPRNIWPYFEDYVKYLGDEMALTSYADFWRWWYIFERYKGDEKGLEELDAMVDECLARGLKVKIDPAWSTWWTQDQDWEKGFKLTVGPQDLNDWIHLCDLLGRRYRGRVAMWDLQGEANDLKGYWQGRPIEHVQELYRLGYKVLKSLDPGCRVGASGATPSVSREDLEWWYGANIKALAGHYDNIPMNYFADVADPYQGGLNYYHSVREKLDAAGQQHVEVGMGETSVQWAETTQNAGTGDLSMENQAVRLNQMFGQLFSAGMDKFIFWGTEFAPGGGHWPWRWGLRNYEDWWGLWPESYKVPGTQIVYRFEPNDEEKKKGDKPVDLRPNWPRPADPFYPAWEVFRFWGQLAPAGAEARVLPLTASDDAAWRKAAFLRTKNEAVALLYCERSTAPLTLSLDLAESGWPQKTPLTLEIKNEAISLRTGEHTPGWRETQAATVGKKPLSLNIPAAPGFTTIVIRPAAEAIQAELEGQVYPATLEVGQPAEGYLILRNKGAQEWSRRRLRLAAFDPNRPTAQPEATWPLPHSVVPGGSAAVRFETPAHEAAGRAWHGLRLHDGKGWVGPLFGVASQVIETQAPRKLVAHREVGHVRLKWFAPLAGPAPRYELWRAENYGGEFKPLATLTGTDYLDTPPQQDKHYFYRVCALDERGERSRFSNDDNAFALSRPRIMDAEVVAHTIPERVRVGDVTTVSVTLRNTGAKAWDLTRPGQLTYRLQPTRLWNVQNEAQLAPARFGELKRVEPGQQVTLEFPFVGPREGRFENHWVLYMEVPGNRLAFTAGWAPDIRYAYFGTPLLVETVVEPK